MLNLKLMIIVLNGIKPGLTVKFLRIYRFRLLTRKVMLFILKHPLRARAINLITVTINIQTIYNFPL